MKKVLQEHPKAVVIFKDTNTILVPDNTDILKNSPEELQQRLAKGDKFKYVEINLHPGKLKNLPILIPASSCLKFPTGRGAGSLSLSYKVDIEMNVNGEGGLSYVNSASDPNMTLKVAIKYTINLKVTKKASFSGTHTCSTVNGKATRLFYSPGTYEVAANSREYIFDSLKDTMFKDEWNTLQPINYLTESAPIYYCGTEDKMDLKCGSPAVEYTDDNGDDIKSKIMEESNDYYDI
ncbi:uncharacterized protein RJT20DRAFT_125789 [Scheffersomyces xylosifermentans]|uniref:uncharacterized protein n=1 Tax=Scheffersomyces xylosifermentans TaxID=1304137 RepID=UPI00315CE84F